MKTWKFSNGDEMPLLGLGTWKSAPNEAYTAVRKAIQLGYRHIDCAFIYMNEEEIGRALNDAMSEGDVTREELWITSKLWNNMHHKDDVVPALQYTLNSFGLDYLDLYLVHWPVAVRKDVVFARSGSEMLSLEEAPIEQTWEGMEACKNNGLSRHIGVSNFSVAKLSQLVKDAQIKPEVNQVELHPLLQQTDLMKYCMAENILLTAYSPLGSRDRSAEMKGNNEPDLFENPTIKSLAEQHQCSPAQIILAWSVTRGTSVIPKSVNPARMQQNLDAMNIELTDADMYRIAGLDKHYRFIDGSFWEIEGSPYTMSNLWDE